MNTSTIYTIIIILFVLSVLFYFIYPNLFGSNQSNRNKYSILLLSGITKFSEDFEQVLPMNTLVKSRNTFFIPYLGYGVSFSWEMYVDVKGGNYDWQSSYNRDKPIIKINDSPVISYNPKKNYISIIVKYRDNPYLTKLTELKYNNVKCQTWVK